MAETRLKNMLSSMVRQYGFERVSQSLREMETSERLSKRARHLERRKTSSDKDPVAKSGRRATRIAAQEYAAKTDISSEKKSLVAELERRFEDKSFLPTFGDVRNFCQIYRINEPASKSRPSAAPRIFKFIAAMKTDDIRRILEDGTFSGPSRLGPVADAIRNRAKFRATERFSAIRTLTSSPSTSSPWRPAKEGTSSPTSAKEGT